LALLKAGGWHAEVVERTIPRINIKRDLWHFADILALHPERGILVVQCTTGSNLAARVQKITDSPLLPLVRKCGIAIEAWGWRKLKTGWAAKVVDLS
jgi:hypothetical protein